MIMIIWDETLPTAKRMWDESDYVQGLAYSSPFT